MPKTSNFRYRGALYHVLSRGRSDTFIFKNRDDKKYFLHILGRGVMKFGVELLAYSIMENHVHLLVSPRGSILTPFIHYLGSAFGRHRRNGRERPGHIFSSSYKALGVEKEDSLLEVSRSIHLDPVRSGATDLPLLYHWSSYRYYVDSGPCPSWLNRGWILDLFGGETVDAHRLYRRFVEKGFCVQSGSGEKKCSESAAARKGREMFISLTMEYTAAVNRETGGFVGSIAQPAAAEKFSGSANRQKERSRDETRRK